MNGDRDVSIYWLARRGVGSEAGGLKPQVADVRLDGARSGANWATVKTTAEPRPGRKFAAAS